MAGNPTGGPDLFQICFRNDELIRRYGLCASSCLEYFYASPFYEHLGGKESLNEAVRDGNMHPGCVGVGRHDMPPGKSSVVVFRLVEHNQEAREPQFLPMHVMVVQRFIRKVVGARTQEENKEIFYCLGGTFYLAPSLARVINKRTSEAARLLQRHFDLSRELVAETRLKDKAENKPDVLNVQFQGSTVPPHSCFEAMQNVKRSLNMRL